MNFDAAVLDNDGELDDKSRVFQALLDPRIPDMCLFVASGPRLRSRALIFFKTSVQRIARRGGPSRAPGDGTQIAKLRSEQPDA